jgi:aminoglycoside phosphotransferase (APT) family kinase protein
MSTRDPEPEPASAVPGIDAPAVSTWLTANITGTTAPFSFTLIAGGRSNLTYRVTDVNGRELVLRRPPLGNVLATAHDMGREHRIISALQNSTVPVAPALGFCDDATVNGAPFYVMGFVDGLVPDSVAAGLRLPEAARTHASHDLIDVLVNLHHIDPDAVGLGTLGRKEGYLERQIKRWTTQWHNSKTRELPIMEEVISLLDRHRPPQVHTGIVHGDYRLGNCLVDPETGSLKAVLDWELCTLGDTLCEIGYLLVYWSDPTPNGTPTRAENDPSGSPGFLSRAEMVERYARATGRDLSHIAYYEAFASWRLACIGEGVLARYRAGVMGDAAGYDTGPAAARVEAGVERSLGLLRSL